MARNLFRLGVLLDNEEWKTLAIKMTSGLSSIIITEPVYMSHWGILFSEIQQGLNEVVVVGEKLDEMRNEMQRHYFPFAIWLGTKTKSKLTLLENREAKNNETMIYVCRNKVCQLPVNIM